MRGLLPAYARGLLSACAGGCQGGFGRCLPHQGIHSGGSCVPLLHSLPCLLSVALCNFQCPHRISFPGRGGCSGCSPCPLSGWPNGARRAALISSSAQGCQCLSSLPQGGLAPSSRPALADGGTGCRGKKPLAAKNQRDRFLQSPKFMPLKQGVCSGSSKGGYGSPHVGMPGLVRPGLRTTNSCNAGQWGEEEMRLAGPIVPSPLEVHRGDGVALLLWKAEEQPG